MDTKVQKWGFDFREGKPLNQLTDSDDPDMPSLSHIYEAVSANEV
jgi:hypothetical protein